MTLPTDVLKALEGMLHHYGDDPRVQCVHQWIASLPTERKVLTDEQIKMAMILTPVYSDDHDFRGWVRKGRAVLAADACINGTES